MEFDLLKSQNFGTQDTGYFSIFESQEGFFWKGEKNEWLREKEKVVGPFKTATEAFLEARREWNIRGRLANKASEEYRKDFKYNFPVGDIPELNKLFKRLKKEFYPSI